MRTSVLLNGPESADRWIAWGPAAPSAAPVALVAYRSAAPRLRGDGVAGGAAPLAAALRQTASTSPNRQLVTGSGDGQRRRGTVGRRQEPELEPEPSPDATAPRQRRSGFRSNGGSDAPTPPPPRSPQTGPMGRAERRPAGTGQHGHRHSQPPPPPRSQPHQDGPSAGTVGRRGPPLAMAPPLTSSQPQPYDNAVAADPASELACARFGSCSGCTLQDGLAAPPLYGEAVAFFRGLGLSELPAVMRAAHGWRCRAKLAVRGPSGRPAIGLFREGSHDVVDIIGPAPPPRPGTPPPPPRRPPPRRPPPLGAASGARSGDARVEVTSGTAAALSRWGRSDAGRSDGGGAYGGGGPARWLLDDDAALSCRAHHPRINQAAELIKELVTEFRVPPYNEPGTASSSAATAATPRPPAAPASSHRRGSLRSRNRLGGAAAAAGAAAAVDPGLLRYVQLTAVPSRPGGRAEEDPAAAIQVVLVLNAPPPSGDDDDIDPRVRLVLRMAAELWSVAGPPGQPLAPTAAAEPPSTAPPTTVAATDAAAAPPPLLHSIWLNFQPDARRNAILGEGWRHVAGPAAAWQEFGGVAACVGPGSFVQANYGAMQAVLREIGDMVPYGSRVTELHAGIGVIGLSLAAARRLAALRLVEVNPAAAAPFRASLEHLRLSTAAVADADASAPPPSQLPSTIEYITAEAGSDPHRFLSDCEVLVVDPPRKGLGQNLLAALTTDTRRPTHGPLAEPPGGAGGGTNAATATEPAELAPPSAPASLPSWLVYLSCGFRALQGDLAVLLAGGWRLRSATAYLFFPGTDSLETLVLLSRD